jgi:DNA-binding MltR family transcriptional regulator
MIDSNAVFTAKKALNEFLELHPEMIPQQKKIDEALKKAGNQHNRMETIQSMMILSVIELNNKLQEIKSEAAKVAEIANKK